MGAWVMNLKQSVLEKGVVSGFDYEQNEKLVILGLEPRTLALLAPCSTDWAIRPSWHIPSSHESYSMTLPPYTFISTRYPLQCFIFLRYPFINLNISRYSEWSRVARNIRPRSKSITYRYRPHLTKVMHRIRGRHRIREHFYFGQWVSAILSWSKSIGYDYIHTILEALPIWSAIILKIEYSDLKKWPIYFKGLLYLVDI